VKDGILGAHKLDHVSQPADSALDVAATLYDLGSETAQSSARESAEGRRPRQEPGQSSDGWCGCCGGWSWLDGTPSGPGLKEILPR